jgi:hypothetical protein
MAFEQVSIWLLHREELYRFMKHSRRWFAKKPMDELRPEVGIAIPPQELWVTKLVKPPPHPRLGSTESLLTSMTVEIVDSATTRLVRRVSRRTPMLDIQT